MFKVGVVDMSTDAEFLGAFTCGPACRSLYMEALLRYFAYQMKYVARLHTSMSIRIMLASAGSHLGLGLVIA